MSENYLIEPIPIMGPHMIVKKTGKVGLFEKLSPTAGPLEQWKVTLRFEGGQLATFRCAELETVFH